MKCPEEGENQMSKLQYTTDVCSRGLHTDPTNVIPADNFLTVTVGDDGFTGAMLPSTPVKLSNTCESVGIVMDMDPIEKTHHLDDICLIPIIILGLLFLILASTVLRIKNCVSRYKRRSNGYLEIDF